MMVMFRTLCVGFLLSVLPKECDSQLSVCGVASLNNKTVGGDTATAGSWPWVVSLRVDNGHFCSGSLINSGWVLTLAKCFQSYDASRVTVYLGTESLDGNNTNQVSRTIISVINSTNTINIWSLVLLQLSSGVTFTPYIAPVCLAASNSTFLKGTLSWATGNEETPLSPGTLQEVQVQISDQNPCNSMYGRTIENIICTNLLESQQCLVDKGGPLVVKQGSVWILAGIVIYFVGCVDKGLDVYINVSPYQSWINQVITSNQPGFITYTSNCTSTDLNVSCSNLPAATTVVTTITTTTTSPPSSNTTTANITTSNSTTADLTVPSNNLPPATTVRTTTTSTTSRTSTPVCGVASLNNKTVGGDTATAGSWPWVVSLRADNGHFCSGSLINSGWVLTSALCGLSYPDSEVTAYLGTESLNGNNTNQVFRTVIKAIINPNFDKVTRENNLALLQLSYTVTFTPYITPVCLAAYSSTFFNGTLSWVTGWGNIASGVSLPSSGNLQEVQVPIIGNKQCFCLYGGRITGNMICAGALSKGKYSCQNDSGGPLVVTHGSIWIQAGIVGYDACNQGNFPGVYTRVSQYQPWINQVITSNQPGYVTYMSSGTNADLNVSCSDLPPITTSTAPPSNTTTANITTSNSTTADLTVLSSNLPPATTVRTTTTSTTSTTTTQPSNTTTANITTSNSTTADLTVSSSNLPPVTTVRTTTTSTTSTTTTPLCGVASLNNKTVGGDTATAGSWPWVVSLRADNGHFCSGSLINSGWVLTSALCGLSCPDSGVTVYLGTESLNGNNTNQVSRTVIKVIINPNFDYVTQENNLALLQLSYTVTFTPYITPVCLAAYSSTFFNGTLSWVTGWGIIASGVSLPSSGNLQEVQVPIIGNKQCFCLYGGRITGNMICAGALSKGKYSCQNDSGGPLVVTHGSIWIQAGIVGYDACNQGNFPGVYTRVSQYQPWINQVITSNQPGYVTYMSSGTNADLNVSCSDLPPITTSTAPPSNTTTANITTSNSTTADLTVLSSNLPPATTVRTTTTSTTSTTTTQPVVCGNANLNNPSGAVTGLASAGMWPWMASVQRNGTHVCGGTLISTQFVMSSADCFSGSTKASGWTVVLGRLMQNGNNSNEVSIKVANITFSNTSQNNIAVLGLAGTPTLSNYIQPICVDQGSNNFTVNTQCWAAGWGSGGGAQQTLQQFSTSIVSCDSGSASTSICTDIFPLEQSERGGPLMCQVGTSWFQAAVLTMQNSTANSSSTTSNSTTSNSTISSNNNTNNTSSSSFKSLQLDVAAQNSNKMIFPKISSFTSFLLSTVGSLPSNTTSALTVTTAKPGSGTQLFISVTSVLLISLPAIIHVLG
ncbi:transmembrane protease serine 9-like isoform X2 [Brachyhypopomus gauderio]|uniref:transmembrane protease serine 9-like isoform X2 n=1 Tax=Brachyhypopomus gauderio TaxID=698409 RepID=UPI004043056A